MSASGDMHAAKPPRDEMGNSDLAVEDAQISSCTLHGFPASEIEAAWRNFLLRADFPSHYVSPEYFREPFLDGKNPFVVLVFRGKRVMGVISGQHEGKLVRCGVHGRPQVAFDPESTESVVLSALHELRREAGDAELVTIYSWSQISSFVQAGYLERVEAPVTVLDLHLPQEVLFKQLSKGRKSDISLAKRKGVTVQIANSQSQFADYYAIYAQWCDRKKQHQVSEEVMTAALQQQASRKLFLAYFDGRPIAGSIVRFIPGGIAEYSANSSLEEYLSMKPNSLLLWSAIEWAAAEKLNFFSMGAGHPFLQHFGGNGFPQFRYRQDFSLFRRHDRLESLRRGIRSAGRRVRDTLRARKA